jgi:very-short-patch-repair endonuclease
VPGVDGIPVAHLDMGWQEWMVAVEYDGDQHRTDRRQYVKDIRRLEMLEEMGWIIVRVVAEDRPAAVLRRVRTAIAASNVR